MNGPIGKRPGEWEPAVIFPNRFPGERCSMLSPARSALTDLQGLLIIAWMMMVSLVWRIFMIRNTRVQMAAVLAVGVLLGYLAASGSLSPRRAEASPST